MKKLLKNVESICDFSKFRYIKNHLDYLSNSRKEQKKGLKIKILIIYKYLNVYFFLSFLDVAVFQYFDKY